jgi:hypothetical protein
VAGAIGPEAEVAALVEHCEYFDLSRSKAKEVLLELSSALGQTDHIAAQLGISKQHLAPFNEVFANSQDLLAKA